MLRLNHLEHEGEQTPNLELSYSNRQIFRIRLEDNGFLDVSSDTFPLKQLDMTPKISLRCLMDKGFLKERYIFYPNDKKVLAYTLAHGLLNLYDSPWLQNLWTPDNIFFAYSAHDNMLYNIHQPYVACVMAMETQPLGTLDELHKYPMIFSFAKLLLELETGQMIEAKKKSKAGNLSLWYTLQDYCRDWSKQQLGKGYAKALEACVNFPQYYIREKKSNSDITVPQVILKYIVRQLEGEVDVLRKEEWGTRDLDLKSYTMRTSKAYEVGSQSTRYGGSKAEAQSPTISSTVRGFRKPPVDIIMSNSPSIPSNGLATSSMSLVTPFREHKEPIDLRIHASNGTNYDNVSSTFEQETNYSQPLPLIADEGDVESGFGSARLLNTQNTTGFVELETFRCLRGVFERHWEPHENYKTIKVAVFDTGYDSSYEFLNEEAQIKRIIASRNFVPGQSHDNVTDIHGHGTHVASIILHLAPHAEVYIGRVCDGVENRGPGVHAVTQVRMAYFFMTDAIEWALNNGVHIINMSFGFWKCPESGLRILRNALAQAQNNNVIVFAAASNNGMHQPMAWPACDRRYSIGIHSCGDSGTLASSFNVRPCSNGENFMVVGENILLPRLKKKGEGPHSVTGTSFAAPVASAIGALVLQFVWQQRCMEYCGQVQTRVALMDIHTNAGMARVLREIADRVSGGFYSIRSSLFWKDHVDGYNETEHAWRTIEKALTL
ncbi:hypothetical protein ABKA04_004573 [Annulohypoxylon sp. FPYF3050]